jgi:hypothetical protein
MKSLFCQSLLRLNLLPWRAVAPLPVLALAALLPGGCTNNSQARTAVAAKPEAVAVAEVRFEDVTKTAGIAFRQYSGGCGQAYFPNS